jgi:hypothetical protein
MRQARAPTERARVSLSIPRAASARGLHQPWRSHPQPSGRRSSAQLVPGHARLRPDAPLRVDKHCRLRVHRCGALPSGQPWLAGRSPQPPSSTRSCAETPQSAAEKAIASALSNLATQAPVRQLRAAAVRQLKPRDKRPTEPAGGESNPSINGGLPAQIRVRCSHKALTCDKGEVFSWRPRVNETLTAVCPQLLVGQLVPDLGVGRNEDRPQEH